MNKATSNAAILSISLDRSARESLQSQLLKAIREMVHEHRLSPGDRLPSSRSLAKEVSVSRITISAVFDQLIAEGYLVARQGSGVYVAEDLPNLPINTKENFSNVLKKEIPTGSREFLPFDTGNPDLTEFPFREWSRAYHHVWRQPNKALLSLPDPLGWANLRVSIASHLRDWRGIDCDPTQIVITSGLAEAIELISGVALDAGSTVLVEEPGHDILRKAFINRGHGCEYVRVDDQGFSLQRAQHSNDAAAAIVTPSRQFPLGMTMPLARRLELLTWASDKGGLIIEDDYDGEFRFQGQPLPAIMSLDNNDRVIYVGSFSKVLMPAIRTGFIVLPKSLIAQVSETITSIGPRASLFPQPVLSRFIDDGSFATHIRRMRRLYGERQKFLISKVRERAQNLLSVEASSGGMHLIAKLHCDVTDKQAVKLAWESGVRVRALSSYYAGKAKLEEHGLILGYAGFNNDQIADGVESLVNALS